ncbi:MAG: hypothetical protein SF028_06045 [Candidatus Sumerlaeia bacterium]|nr:hypothetical protein [Candidatus Sumerlaeia bacterium]
MRKKLTYEHLDNGSRREVVLHIYEEDGHFVSKIDSLDGSADAPAAPTFYGTTPEQAERQTRKVLEKDWELVAEEAVGE